MQNAAEFQKISNLTKAIEDAKAAQEKSKTAAEGAIKKVTESSKSAVEKVKKGDFLPSPPLAPTMILCVLSSFLTRRCGVGLFG